MRRLLVTGGAGFIGANFVHYWIQKYRGDFVVVLDALTYDPFLAYYGIQVAGHAIGGVQRSAYRRAALQPLAAPDAGSAGPRRVQADPGVPRRSARRASIDGHRRAPRSAAPPHDCVQARPSPDSEPAASRNGRL